MPLLCRRSLSKDITEAIYFPELDINEVVTSAACAWLCLVMVNDCCVTCHKIVIGIIIDIIIPILIIITTQ